MYHKSWCPSGDLRGKDEQGREQDPGLVALEADREAESEVFNPLPLPYPLAQMSHGEARATANHACRAQASCRPGSLEKGKNSPGVGCWWLCSASSGKPFLWGYPLATRNIEGGGNPELCQAELREEGLTNEREKTDSWSPFSQALNSYHWILQQRQRQRVGSGPPLLLFHAISRWSPHVLSQPHLVPGPPGNAPVNNQPFPPPGTFSPASWTSLHCSSASAAPPCGAPSSHPSDPAWDVHDPATLNAPGSMPLLDFYMYHSTMLVCLCQTASTVGWGLCPHSCCIPRAQQCPGAWQPTNHETLECSRLHLWWWTLRSPEVTFCWGILLLLQDIAQHFDSLKSSFADVPSY